MIGNIRICLDTTRNHKLARGNYTLFFPHFVPFFVWIHIWAEFSVVVFRIFLSFYYLYILSCSNNYSPTNSIPEYSLQNVWNENFCTPVDHMSVTINDEKCGKARNIRLGAPPRLCNITQQRKYSPIYIDDRLRATVGDRRALSCSRSLERRAAHDASRFIVNDGL